MLCLCGLPGGEGAALNGKAAKGGRMPCFCTPIGAEIIGWDNGIHYCFIEGFGDMVFCVNPETCCDYFVYPIARNFCDFLGLILATGGTNTLQQIIWWDKKMFDDFVNHPRLSGRLGNWGAERGCESQYGIIFVAGIAKTIFGLGI